MERLRTVHTNSHRRWEAGEERRLACRAQEGATIAQLMAEFGNENAITARLNKDRHAATDSEVTLEWSTSGSHEVQCGVGGGQFSSMIQRAYAGGVASIEALIPTSAEFDVMGLREVDAGELVRYIVNRAHPAWRRRACVLGLTDRVPPQHVPALIARIRDPNDQAGVRVALLDLLGDQVELLPWLRLQRPDAEDHSGMFEAVLKARWTLGDRTAVPDLATLADDPWPHRRALGLAGIEALTAQHGSEQILADLDDARPEDRAIRVRLRHNAGNDVTEAFADADVGVAHLAYSLINNEEMLRTYLDRAPNIDAKLWTVCALFNCTGDLAEIRSVYDSLGRPRVEIGGLDEEIRAAIVREYAPGERRSDPRWRIETICTELPPAPDVDGQLRGAMAALASAGLEPQSPVPCGVYQRQGAGTYFVIEHAGGCAYVSTLGRFVTGHDARRAKRRDFVTGNDAETAARNSLEAAGFRWINKALGETHVDGLCVYYFGHRDPLDVQTLLFYWQD